MYEWKVVTSQDIDTPSTHSSPSTYLLVSLLMCIKRELASGLIGLCTRFENTDCERSKMRNHVMTESLPFADLLPVESEGAEA